MQLGVVGLPNAGKSTLFNCLTGAGAETGVYPFTTVEQNVGTVEVPDDRLIPVAEALGSAQVVPATVRIVDIAGLVRGASRGEGLGNRFLGHIRQVDAIAHVVRAFHRDDVTHSEGEVDPLRDIHLIEAELRAADLDAIERRRETALVRAKGGQAAPREELGHLDSLQARIKKDEYLAASSLSHGEERLLQELHLLTRRPVVYVVNVDEELAASGEGNPLVEPILRLASERGMRALVLTARFEEELTALLPGEREDFLDDLGLEETARDRFLRMAHDVLGLITYFTGNERETRARSLPGGQTVVEAARKVHSDMAEGFIRAEVIKADDLIRAGSRTEAQRRGSARIQGRDYIVQEGDVIQVRFDPPGTR